jgi:hypothetical protein
VYEFSLEDPFALAIRLFMKNTPKGKFTTIDTIRITKVKGNLFSKIRRGG